jgi:hypothetical protein
MLKPKPKTVYKLRSCFEYICEKYMYSEELKASIASYYGFPTTNTNPLNESNFNQHTAESSLEYWNWSRDRIGPPESRKRAEVIRTFLQTLIEEFGKGVFYE